MITVNIQTPSTTPWDERAIVRDALTFWTTTDTPFTLRFTIVNDTSADVSVSFVDQIRRCGYETDDHVLGCADLLPSDGVYETQATARIATGYNRSSTLKTTKHELGHILGYTHSDSDRFAFMNATTAAVPYRVPNATERANPFQTNNLTVYVGEPEPSYYSEYERQVKKTLEYYANGANGYVPSNISFEYTEDRKNATVVVLFDALDDGGSESQVYGYDRDQDASLEVLSQVVVRMQSIDEHHVGWHLGYWLADAFNSRGEAMPAPFDAPQRDQREDWWEQNQT